KFEPLWLDKMNDPLFISELKKINDSIVYEGLEPAHYGYKKIEELLSSIKKQKVEDQYITCAEIETSISQFLISVWHDKVLGRTDPRIVLGMKYTLPYPNHPKFRLFDVLLSDTGRSKIQKYHPQDSDYFRLKGMLHQAYAITEGSETYIDTAGIGKIEPGDTCNIVPLLAQRLAELDLIPDSLIAIYENEIVYTRYLASKIKLFQKNSNLTDDGIIGKTTLKLLNASRNDKIDEIRANLERVRWFGIQPPKPYIRVNIPEFTLYMHYPADSVKTLLVCIGKGKERYYDRKLKKYTVSKSYMDKPLNHETPQVYSNIDYVILNPTWTVPSSIVGREMYNLIVRDPNYLTKNNYQVFKNGSQIDPKSINWRKLSPGNIPYTIRQNAGDDNSLGKIKFTFKNPFDVYLHDTPLKSKFKLNNRAVSHGCVRVQSPVDLTGFVLQENKRVTYDDVLIMMGIPPLDSAKAIKWKEDTTSYKKIVKKTYPIRLENKMTVFFDYKTIVFDAYNRPRFIFDVYDKNRSIIEALNKK
ncbi:MAG TPA: L,D-transpeptidase family protein, partial [Bacteroidia bacterium]